MIQKKIREWDRCVHADMWGTSCAKLRLWAQAEILSSPVQPRAVEEAVS